MLEKDLDIVKLIKRLRKAMHMKEVIFQKR